MNEKTLFAISFAFHDLQPFITWHVLLSNSILNLRTISLNLIFRFGCPSIKSHAPKESTNSYLVEFKGDLMSEPECTLVEFFLGKIF